MSLTSICRNLSSLAGPRCLKLEPGLVLLKKAFSEEQQVQLAKQILELGSRPEEGFWRLNAQGEKVLNSRPYRGRMFNALKSFPSSMSALCERQLSLTTKADDSLPNPIPTHLIVLYYKTLLETPAGEYIPWHQDNGENDGEENSSVVSFSLGDSWDFLVAHHKPRIIPGKNDLTNPQNLAHRILFESGDVLVFGGPCRFIWHAVHKIYAGTAPSFLPFQDARLNLTFRYAPKILGDEKRFATVPSEELPKDNQFYKMSKMR